MSKYNDKQTELKQAMIALRQERSQIYDELKEQVYHTSEYLRPSSILMRTLKDFNKEPEYKTTVITSVTSIIGGYLSKKFLFGKSSSAIKKILGIGIQVFTAKLIAGKMTHH